MGPVITPHVAEENFESFLLSQEVSHGGVIPQLFVLKDGPEELFEFCPTLLYDLFT